MQQRVTDFFQQYANAMQNKQLKLLKSIYRLPFIIVHDEPKSVVSFEQELESNLKQVLASFEKQSIVDIKANVEKSLHLSNDIYFVNVSWTFKDESQQQVLGYNTSYMISIMDDKIEIITVIIDDKNDTYLQLID